MIKAVRIVFIVLSLLTVLILPFENYSSSIDLSCYKRIAFSFLTLFILYLFLPKIFKFFLFPFVIIISIQFISFYSTGEYLNPLAIENISAFNDVGTRNLIKFLFIFLIISLTFIVSINVKINIKKSSIYTAVLLLIFACLSLKKNYPILNFYETASYVYSFNFKNVERYDGNIFKKGFSSGVDSEDIYLSKGDIKNNVIVLFIEGMSDRVISSEHTPHLSDLKKKSLNFSNYYNHTAATFRGIRGQLISGYQKIGGYYKDQIGVGNMKGNKLKYFYENNQLESLPSILNGKGYKSIFVGPHECGDNLYSLLKLVGFNEIKGKCDYSDHDNKIGFPYLTDNETFSLLKKVVKEYWLSDKPFFISFYNIQTHHGMIVNEHVYDDSKNEYYDKFYNLDYYLGDFIKYLETENILDNTVVVITADHSTYSVDKFEKSYNYKSLSRSRFVDKIPLIIYSRSIKPQDIDVKGRNSLGLSPTILDLLGLKNINTHFLGNSLFREEHSYWENISIVNDIFIHTENSEVYDLPNIDEKHLHELELFYRFAM